MYILVIICSLLRSESDLLRQQGEVLMKTGEMMNKHAEMIDVYMESIKRKNTFWVTTRVVSMCVCCGIN